MKFNLPTIESCNGCGACCMEQAALPIHLVGTHFRMKPVRKLPPALVAELKAMAERFMAEGFPPDGAPCIWFDRETRRCKHYPYRPELCLDEVKPGDDACRRWREEKGVDVKQRFALRGGRLVEA